MLSVVIRANTGGERLANTLAAVVPAVAEGLVGDGWIVTDGDDPDIEIIADAAGCHCLAGKGSLAEAVGKANSDWLMFLLAGAAPEEGWWREAAAFIKQMDASGQTGRPAAFSYADPRYAWSGRLVEHLTHLKHMATGRPNPLQGLIAPRSRLLGNAKDLLADNSFPPLLPGRTAKLRARAVAP